MSIAIANTEITNTFDQWRIQTNLIAFAISNNCLTANLGVASVTTGNATLDGILTATTMSSGNGVFGNLTSNSYVYIANNTLSINPATHYVHIGSTACSSPTVALFVTGAITATGDITGYSSSDKTFKKNIELLPLSKALYKLSQFSVKTFEWDTEALQGSAYTNPDNSGKDVGLIAQEVQTFAPEFVQERPDGTLAVAYHKLVPYLVASVQALQREIQDLRNGK